MAKNKNKNISETKVEFDNTNKDIELISEENVIEESLIKEEFLIRNIKENQVVLEIDGYSVAFEVEIPFDVYANKNKYIGKFVAVKHYGKNEITKELKNFKIQLLFN